MNFRNIGLFVTRCSGCFMKREIMQLLENISGLLLKLTEHIIIVSLYYVALKVLLILSTLVFNTPDLWSDLFVVLIKGWFLTVFGIYALDDIIKYYKEKFYRGT